MDMDSSTPTNNTNNMNPTPMLVVTVKCVIMMVASLQFLCEVWSFETSFSENPSKGAAIFFAAAGIILSIWAEYYELVENPVVWQQFLFRRQNNNALYVPVVPFTEITLGLLNLATAISALYLKKKEDDCDLGRAMGLGIAGVQLMNKGVATMEWLTRAN